MKPPHENTPLFQKIYAKWRMRFSRLKRKKSLTTTEKHLLETSSPIKETRREHEALMKWLQHQRQKPEPDGTSPLLFGKESPSTQTHTMIMSRTGAYILIRQQKRRKHNIWNF